MLPVEHFTAMIYLDDGQILETSADGAYQEALAFADEKNAKLSKILIGRWSFYNPDCFIPEKYINERGEADSGMLFVEIVSLAWGSSNPLAAGMAAMIIKRVKVEMENK